MLQTLNFEGMAVLFVVNKLPYDKILDWSKLKQIADDILIKVHVKWKRSTT